MFVLQEQEWLPFWGEVLLRTSSTKWSKSNDDESAVVLLKKVIGMNKDLSPTNITIDQGNLIRGVIKSWDEIHRNVNYLMHDNWVAYFRT